MDRIKGHMPDLRNIGLIDRMLRFFIGGGLMFLGVLSIVVSGKTEIWEALVVLLAIYPLMTCMMGWDPFYQLASMRTGREEGHNVTGTLPYQVDAALGHHPVPDKDYEYDHSLAGSHHEPTKTKVAAGGR